MALINGIIPTSNFELIRDKLGEILATEYANQAALTSNAELNPQVYIERFIQVDKTECPLVNICLTSGTYDNESQKSSDGNYTYNIDLYVNAKSTTDDTGDKLATLKLHRLIAVTRAIIKSPRYKTLGYEAPFNCNITVSNIQITDPINNADGTHLVQGRMEVVVRVPETVELITNAPKVYTNVTQVKLYETDKGYRYVWSSLAGITVTAGTSFTLPTEYSGMTVELVSDGTQTYNSGFTQSGDVITMTNGVVFTNGQVIVVTLSVNDYTATLTLASGGPSFTMPDAYSGKTILLVNDGTQTYTNDPLNFTQDGLDITMTNGVEFTAGQQVTIWYGVQLVTTTAYSETEFKLPAQYRNFEQVLVFDGTQSYSTGFDEPEVITTMTDGVEFTPGQNLIIALR